MFNQIERKLMKSKLVVMTVWCLTIIAAVGGSVAAQKLCSKASDGVTVNVQLGNSTRGIFELIPVDQNCNEIRGKLQTVPNDGGMYKFSSFKGAVYRVRQVGTGRLFVEIVIDPAKPIILVQSKDYDESSIDLFYMAREGQEDSRSTSSGQNCKPADNQIAVYKDWKFTGDCKVLNVGEYADITATDFENDAVSSVKVGRNVQAVICENNDFGGVCQTFNSDSESLEGSQVGNDRTSSIKVTAKNAATGNQGNNNSGPNSKFIEGYTGPTTKRELIITLPFAKAQKLTVEVADDGRVFWQGDMLLGNISNLARNDSPSYDVNSRIASNPFLNYFVKASYGKTDFTSAGTMAGGFAGSNPRSSGAAFQTWSNSTIPYVIQPGHRKRDVILAAINEINSRTNLCLVPRTNETDYVEFISEDGKGFWATLGKSGNGGRQVVSIDQTDKNVPQSTVIHEVMHAAGFDHTQSRQDRDKYVIIHLENLKPGLEGNFEKVTDPASNIGPYDLTSIMHYGANAGSKNGKNVIDLVGGGDTSMMGTSEPISAGDIVTIATIYAPGPCKPAGEKPTPTPTSTPTSSPSPQPTATKPTPSPQPTPTTTGNGNEGNVAIGKKARQNGINKLQQDGSDANKAIDGNTDGRFDAGSVTQSDDDFSRWWEVDLGAVYDVSNIVIWNRTDECCWSSQQNFMVATSAADVIREQLRGDIVTIGVDENNQRNGNFGPFSPWTANKTNFTVPINRKARYIRIFLVKTVPYGKTLPGLNLAEVQVFGTPVPGVKPRTGRP